MRIGSIGDDYLECTVYRPYFDCTNKGISSKNDTITVYKNKELAALAYRKSLELKYPTDAICYIGEPPTMLGQGYKHIKPYTEDGKHYMMGGNYAHPGDSRWSDLTGGIRYPLPIHDRTES